MAPNGIFNICCPSTPASPATLWYPLHFRWDGWNHLLFFCTASERARDVVQDYCETKMGTLPPHKFTNYVIGNQAYEDLPERDELDNLFRYLLEVYVDDFVSLVIPTSHEQLRHVSMGTMTGIHDVFPADDIDSNDPISEKKLMQLDGEYSTKKTILGFDFDGIEKTIWLKEAKRAHFLTVLQVSGNGDTSSAEGE